MIEVSKDRLDKIAKKISLDRKINRFSNFIGKAFVPVVAAELLLSFLMQDKLHFLLWILIFAVADIVLTIAALFFIIFTDTAAKIIRSTGSITDAVRMSRLVKREKTYYDIFNKELCSDEALAAADRLVKSADKNKIGYLAALTLKLCCHDMRCETDKAGILLAEIENLPEKRLIERNEHMVAQLDYCSATNNDLRYLSVIEEYSDLLAGTPERCGTGSALSAFLAITAQEAVIDRRYDTALEYYDWALEYRNEKNTYSKKSPSNMKIYNTAALHLDKAAALLKMGDAQAASEELGTADDLAAELTCEIPPIFLKERGELVSLLTILP